MDTIKSYFEHLFMALPVNGEVKRAKEELLGIAEDRYHELKDQGKSENEAIGTVIEEFGNIDELASELGISVNGRKSYREHFMEKKEAEIFLNTYEKADYHLGLGIFLLYISPVMLIFLGLLNSRSTWYNDISPIVSPAFIVCLGVPFLLVLIALGLCLIIYSLFSRRPYRYLENERFVTAYDAGVFINEKHVQQQRQFVFRIMIAVTLLVIGIVPLVFMGAFYDGVPVVIRGIAVDAFMVMYGLSIMFFILAGMSQKRFKIITQTGRFARKRLVRL